MSSTRSVPSLLDLSVPPPGFHLNQPPPPVHYMYPMHSYLTPAYHNYPPPMVYNSNGSATNYNNASTVDYNYSLPTESQASSLGGVSISILDSCEPNLNSWLEKNFPVDHMDKESPLLMKSAAPDLTLLDVKLMLHKLNVYQLQLRDSAAHDDKGHSLTAEVQELLSFLDKADTKKMIAEKVARAKARKLRRAKTKESNRKKKQESVIRRAEVTERIDKWYDKIQEQKQTEEMKKAADESLSGVRQKISDVNKHKKLIQALAKLRNARSHTAQQQGKAIDTESQEVFEKKTNELILMLDKQYSVYKKEELALQVMLDHEQDTQREVKRLKEEKRKQKELERQETLINRWLFGNTEVSNELQPFYDYYTQAEQNLQALLQIRLEWDQYIVPDSTEGSSNIPRGWVIPSQPSSEIWSQYLQPVDTDS